MGASESEDAGTIATARLRQLRRLGISTLISGAGVIAGAVVFPDPFDPLVGGLGFLGIAVLVFEYTEGYEPGFSLGFLLSGLIVWLAPRVGTAPAYRFTGGVLVFVGLVNMTFPQFTVYFQRRGGRVVERLVESRR